MTNKLLLIICAILLPPVAVGLKTGLGGQLAIPGSFLVDLHR
jgi:uncharacterized membrane protein YqaE (UPF0057 family)